MKLRISNVTALGLAAALTLGASTSGVAQTDTTQRDTTGRVGATSTRRIPLRKDAQTSGRTGQTTRRESGGEVMTRDINARTDSLFLVERSRVDSMFMADRARLDELSTRVNGLNDQVAGVRRDVDALRTSTEALRTSQMALSDTLNRLRTAFDRMRNRSLFGNSGFTIGVGIGGNFPNGTLHEIGYDHGLHVAVPIGWNRPGSMLGVKAELAVQTFDGLNNVPRVVQNSNGTTALLTGNNPDQRMYSGVGMLQLNFPVNARGTNTFYLLGGGGAYMFRNVSQSSAIAQYLGDDIIEDTDEAVEKNVTKYGLTGGAGFTFGLIGPAQMFIETRFTNVFGDNNRATGGENSNLRWVPVMVGFQLK